jgi:hypothetical protein
MGQMLRALSWSHDILMPCRPAESARQLKGHGKDTEQERAAMAKGRFERISGLKRRSAIVEWTSASYCGWPILCHPQNPEKQRPVQGAGPRHAGREAFSMAAWVKL